MMEDFVPFELAKKLQEKGFYYKCVATYDNDCMLGYNYIQPTNIRAIGFDDCLCSHNVENDGCIDAPTISQVLKWLREEKNVEVIPSFDYEERIWGYQVGDMNLRVDVILAYLWDFKTYESAALAGITYTLDNLI